MSEKRQWPSQALEETESSCRVLLFAVGGIGAITYFDIAPVCARKALNWLPFRMRRPQQLGRENTLERLGTWPPKLPIPVMTRRPNGKTSIRAVEKACSRTLLNRHLGPQAFQQAGWKVSFVSQGQGANS